jgi:hypothetical protein
VPFAPVNVIFGEAAFLHTAVVPLIDAVGNGFTVIVALPVCICEHVVVLASLTLTREYVNTPVALVGTVTVTLFPEVVETVWLLPLLTV